MFNMPIDIFTVMYLGLCISASASIPTIGEESVTTLIVTCIMMFIVAVYPFYVANHLQKRRSNLKNPVEKARIGSFYPDISIARTKLSIFYYPVS